MTQNKRFDFISNYITLDGGVFATTKNRQNAELISRTLNQLYYENGQLKKENKELKELVREVDNELEIRDIVCGARKFRLEEWGKHRVHQFYKGDEKLEDESVVIMLRDLENENEQLKQQLTSINQLIDNKIDEFKNGDYGDLPCNTIHMFLDLKEEIGDYSDRE